MHLLLIIIPALVVVALGIYYRSTLKAKFTGLTGSGGTAFTKVAVADAKKLDLQGKVIALKAANSATHAAASELESAAAAIHKDADSAQSRLEAVDAAL